MKIFVLGFALVLALASGALAQDRGALSRGDGSDGGGAPRIGHITSTGETVPNPGASQSAGTTSMDRGIQSRDNKIDSSICKGC